MRSLAIVFALSLSGSLLGCVDDVGDSTGDVDPSGDDGDHDPNTPPTPETPTCGTIHTNGPSQFKSDDGTCVPQTNQNH